MIATNIRPLLTTSNTQTSLFAVLQVCGASLFLALCAQISIPLYFSPVPLSGQTFGVMLIGALLGRRIGMWSVLAYLIEGSLGLPVFAGGNAGGLATLVGSNGGYFLGFFVQVYLAGRLSKSYPPLNVSKIFTLLITSCAVQLGLGVLWLSCFTGYAAALSMGLYPFIFGECVKCLTIATCLKMR